MNIAVACPVALQCSIIHIVSIFCACTWMYRLLQIGALKNNSAISILTCVFWHTCTGFSRGYISGTELLSSSVCAPLVMVDNVRLFSKVIIPMYRLSSSIGEFLLPHILAIFGVVSLFRFSQSGGYIIVSHCGLNFPNYLMRWGLFPFLLYF